MLRMTASPVAVTAVAAALLAGACTSAAQRSTGPKAPPMARQGDDALVDDAWGVGLLIDPATATTTVDERRFVVDTLARGDLAMGVFQFTAEVDPTRAQAGSAALALAERESWVKDGGSELSEVIEVSFLGRPAHAFTFRDTDSFGLEVTAVVGRCVFSLVVFRSGEPAWMTQYASAVLRNIKPLSGGPIDPARCQ